MKISEVAKKVLFVSALLTASAEAVIANDVAPELDCGLYSLRGHLVLKPHGDLALIARWGSSSPLEFLVLGGNLKVLLRHFNTDVTLKVYVPNPIRHYRGAQVWFEALLSESSQTSFSHLLHSEKCREMKFFKN